MKRLLVLFLLLQGCLPPCSNCPPPTTKTETPTPEATAKPTPTKVPTPVPPPVSIPAGPLAPLTLGRATLLVDRTNFVYQDGLDSYAFATFCWLDPHAPVRPQDRPTTPCVQLALRGPGADHLSVEVRESANIRFDGTKNLPENKMCGQGTRPNRWLKLPAGQTVRVFLEFGPGFVRAASDVDSQELHQGAAVGNPPGSTGVPGYGWWIDGIPKAGIGWSYQDWWMFSAHGGKATLLSWEPMGTQGVLGVCP